MPALRFWSLPLAVAIVACHRGASNVETAVTPAGATAAAAAPAMPAGVTDEMIARGQTLFASGSCFRCHGVTGSGTERGPSLLTGPWLHHRGSYDDIIVTITTGVPASAIRDSTRRLAMNPRGGPMNLTDPQVRDVAAYVWSISRNKR